MKFKSSYFFLVVSLTLHAALAHAEPLVQNTLLFNARKLSDDELSMVRGRYVSKDAILYLGVEMLTQWQTPDDVHTAAMSVQFDRSKGFVPTITSVYGEGNNTQQDATGAIDNAKANGQSSGLHTITGAAQTLTVAGRGNRINNDMAIDVCPNKCAGITHSATGTTTLLTPGGGSTTLVSESGMTTTFTSGNGKIGMALRNDQGQILQQVTQGRGILQSANINSDKNHIQNLHLINIGLRPGSSLKAASGGIGSMLDRVRALNTQ